MGGLKFIQLKYIKEVKISASCKEKISEEKGRQEVS